jgi:hypothetical protein
MAFAVHEVKKILFRAPERSVMVYFAWITMLPPAAMSHILMRNLSVPPPPLSWARAPETTSHSHVLLWKFRLPAYD